MDELRWFTAKKAILVSFCFIDIVVYIIYASAAKHFANKFITENGSNKENSTATTADAIEDELVSNQFSKKHQINYTYIN